MSAFVIKEFGNYKVLNKESVAIPLDILDDEILIKVSSASYNPSDTKTREGAFKSVTPIDKYRIIGFDFAGKIVKKGKSVKDFNLEDEIFGYQSIRSNGSYAEYIKTKAKNISLAPNNISLKDSAALPVAGTAAYKSFKNLNLNKDAKVLINGVSGGVGTFLLQMIKIKNPSTKVIGTASKRSFEMLKKLNIDSIIDYKKTDVHEFSDEKYDAIINLVELDKKSINNLLDLLHENGTLLSTTNSPEEKLLEKKNIYFKSIFASPDKEILTSLKDMVEEGLRPIITERYKFNEIKEVHKKEDKKSSNGKTLIEF